MPPFPRPSVDYSYDPAREVRALRRWRDQEPATPERAGGRLVVATWNVANLGVHERTDADHRLIAEIVGWFDLVAIQEVADDLAGLRAVMGHLPRRYRLLVSDTQGNDERAAFLYDSRRVELLELVGRLAIPPADLRHIRLPGLAATFQGFDRSPYLAAFRASGFRCTFANVHLFFGGESPADIARRQLEAYAIGRWADLRSRDPHAYAPDIVALGDFNLPRVEPGDPIYRALTRRGLALPPHSARIASSIMSESHYDQLAFVPNLTGAEFTGQIGVFDFDGAVFADLWERARRPTFLSYVRYHLSDHRPLWAAFRTG